MQGIWFDLMLTPCPRAKGLDFRRVSGMTPGIIQNWLSRRLTTTKTAIGIAFLFLKHSLDTHPPKLENGPLKLSSKDLGAYSCHHHHDHFFTATKLESGQWNIATGKCHVCLFFPVETTRNGQEKRLSSSVMLEPAHTSLWKAFVKFSGILWASY